MTVATTGLAGRACSVKALTVVPEIVQTGSRVSRRERVAPGITLGPTCGHGGRAHHRGGAGAAPTPILVYPGVRDAPRRLRER